MAEVVCQVRNKVLLKVFYFPQISIFSKSLNSALTTGWLNNNINLSLRKAVVSICSPKYYVRMKKICFPSRPSRYVTGMLSRMSLSNFIARIGFFVPIFQLFSKCLYNVCIKFKLIFDLLHKFFYWKEIYVFAGPAQLINAICLSVCLCLSVGHEIYNFFKLFFTRISFFQVFFVRIFFKGSMHRRLGGRIDQVAK